MVRIDCIRSPDVQVGNVDRDRGNAGNGFEGSIVCNSSIYHRDPVAVDQKQKQQSCNTTARLAGITLNVWHCWI